MQFMMGGLCSVRMDEVMSYSVPANPYSFMALLFCFTALAFDETDVTYAVLHQLEQKIIELGHLINAQT
jgi:hypothetical protein